MWKSKKAVEVKNRQIEQFAQTLEAQVNEKTRELRTALGELQRYDRLKDEFLANTSHELRTPLNGIIGIAESLLAGTAGKLHERVVENLSMIVFSSKRLFRLVNDILDFSRLKNNDLNLQQKPVDIRQIANIVLMLYSGPQK